MSNNKNKGNNFEREISKKLSLWWSENKRDDIFWRTQSSGAFYTIRKKFGKQLSTQYGDIQAIDKDGQPFLECVCIEVKRGYNIDFFDFLSKKKSKFQIFLNQAKNLDKQPVLIYKKDRKKTIIFFEKTLFLKMQDFFSSPNFPYILMFFPDFGESFFCSDFDNFLKWCHPDFFKNYFTK